VVFSIAIYTLFHPQLVHLLPSPFHHEAWSIFILTIISTPVVLIVAGLITKRIFVNNPDYLLSILAVPFFICFVLLLPLMFTVLIVFRIMTRLSGKKYDDRSVFGIPDPNRFIRSAQTRDEVEDTTDMEAKIFHNAMEFKSVRVRECMIPRTEIVAVAIDEGMEKLKEAFVESGHSKIIIYRENIDDVIGFCHSSALFKKPHTIEEILTPIIAVPETTMASELMIKFIDDRKSLAVVLDEFGGTSGLVSMEDVIEEIFGEIEDEHDEDDLIEQKLDERTYLLSARLEVDYLNETYHWELPEGDYETLSGLILTHTENIPQPNEKVIITRYTFIIQSTLDNRIDVVMMIIEPE
jgi:CBS domain containing-hemolysin-like protein